MESSRVIPRIVYFYTSLLAIHFIWNPFVPKPEAAPSRAPASLLVLTDVNQPPVHTDKHGLLVQADGDGGDTAQRTGMFYFVHHDRDAFTQALDHLEVAPGIYVRHPTQPGFRSDPGRFSRDQQRPLIIALGKYGMRDRLWRLAKAQLLRLGKYQNLDFIGPVGLGEYIRAFEAKPLYPVVMVTDGLLFLSSLYLVTIAAFDPDEVDDNNHVMTLIQAQNIMPTPWSWLALKAYQTLRPANYGNSVLGKEDPVQGALAWYHRAESGGNPYIGEAIYQTLKSSEEKN